MSVCHSKLFASNLQLIVCKHTKLDITLEHFEKFAINAVTQKESGKMPSTNI